MPPAGTPLRTIERHISTRAYLLLSRNGYDTCEQVALASDEELLALWHMGPGLLRRIRRFAGPNPGAERIPPGWRKAGPDRYQHIDTGALVTFSGRRVDIDRPVALTRETLRWMADYGQEPPTENRPEHQPFGLSQS